MISHIYGCIFHYISWRETLNNSVAETWLRKNGLDEVHWELRYLNSFYFTIINMSTVN
jgi:hypothetical protein